MLFDAARPDGQPLTSTPAMARLFPKAQPAGLIEILREGTAWKRLEELLQVRSAGIAARERQ